MLRTEMCSFLLYYLISQKEEFLLPSKMYNIFNALSALNLTYNGKGKEKKKKNTLVDKSEQSFAPEY